MTSYQWREGGPTPRVDADTFGGVVERLASGRPLFAVKAQDIVDEAGKRGSPIKRMFDWDNDSAGNAWRCQQARHWLGRLQVVVVSVRGGRAVSSRAFYSVNPGERGYMARDRVLSDRDLTLQVIMTAKRELETYLVKYEGALRMGNYIPRLRSLINDMQSDIGRLADKATATTEAAE